MGSLVDREGCHWVKDEDGEEVLIPMCMGALHDPSGCTCRPEAMEAERVRRKHEDELRRLRAMAQRRTQDASERLYRRQRGFVDAIHERAPRAYWALQEWVRKMRQRYGEARNHPDMIRARRERNTWREVAEHWRQRARDAGDVGPEHPETEWNGNNTMGILRLDRS